MEAEQIIRSIMVSKTFYQVLRVDHSASTEQIRKAYLHLSRHVHPDKCRHVHAKDAFHKLKTAYEVLRNPRSRRTYDSNGCENGQDGNEGMFGSSESPQMDWTQFLREIVHEFMNSNYEPVLAVVDYFPELSITRESARDTLNSLRQTISNVQVGYDLIRPELRAFADIRQQNSKLSIFNFTGRLRNSLATTKIVLSILDKCSGDVNIDDEDQTATTMNRAHSVDIIPESSLNVNETGSIESNNVSTMIDMNEKVSRHRTAIKTMISVVEAAEKRLESSWF